MKVVALLSGGKDSIYNLLHCIINDHEPTAVASLGPGKGKDELDSYMYQTVAHSGLSLIAGSLSLPFYNRTITGTAVSQSSTYGNERRELVGVEGDETEDLFELLKEVVEKEPEIKGVAVGAILSNYQRVRVEHVCTRLGLVPIAYLWERNQEELLGEMIKAGMESVLVKVAGAGLGVEHLGKSLREMEPTLHRLNKRYELHICGEGGEYETFTVDSPIFKKRIVFDKTSTVISNSDPYSTVAHLHLDECSLSDKPGHPQNETFEELKQRVLSLVTVPPLFDETSRGLLDQVKSAGNNIGGIEHLSLTASPVASTSQLPLEISPPTSTISDSYLHFSEIASPSSPSISIETEVKSCFTALMTLLSNHNSTLLDISHLTIYLSPSSMSLFPRINSIYSSYFGSSPPTRACVSIPLPSNTRIKLEGVAYIASTSLTSNGSSIQATRESLHVQSLSYWAAANIGPYSQSIFLNKERLFVAGQIGLVPSNLILKNRFEEQAVLALQHLRKIIIASSTFLNFGTGRRRAGDGEAEGEVVKGWCEIGLGWIKNCSNDKEWRTRLDLAQRCWFEFEEMSVEGKGSGRRKCPFVWLSAEQLPKGALIEWQVVWGFEAREEETYSSDEEGESSFSSGTKRGFESWSERVTSAGTSIHVSESRATAKVISILVVPSLEGSEMQLDLGRSVKELMAIRVIHKPSLSISKIRSKINSLLGMKSVVPTISFIASNRIATRNEDDVELVLIMTASAN